MKILSFRRRSIKLRPSWSFYLTLISVGLMLMHTYTLAQQTTANPSVSALKKLSIEQLLNIEVTSVSKRSEKLTEAASAIQVITQDDIRRSGATSLPEVLRLATNLQVAQVNSSQWAISARGFNNALANKLLVLIDGRTVYTPLYAGVFWDVQNVLLEDIERIEVISGPGGALWGANAMNGVINITTKSAKNSQGLLVEAAAGTEFRSYGGLRYGGKLNKDVYYKIYGMAFKKGNTLTSEDTIANDAWTMAQGGFQINWDATEKDAVMLQTNLYDNRPNPNGTTAQDASGHNIVSRWVHTHSAASGFQLHLYYDQTWRDFRNGFTEKLKTYDLDWQHRFPMGHHQEVIWGLGYRFMDHDVENSALLKFLPQQKNLQLYNLFVQDEITLIKDRLNLTIGSKFEHNSYTGLQYQPSGRLAFTVLKSQTLWASISRAVRTPARIDRDFFLYATPDSLVIAGNDNFISEKVLAYELGWRFQSQSKFTLSVATFYNAYDNIRSVEPGPSPSSMPLTLGNGVDGYTYGLELSGTHQPYDWWRLRGGYTFLKKELSIKPFSNDLSGGRAESNDPEHQFLVQSMMNLQGSIELGFTVRYVDELPNPRVAAYWEMDASIAWRPIKMIELSIVGQNLLDNRHIEFIPSSPAPRNIQNSIYGKLAFQF